LVPILLVAILLMAIGGYSTNGYLVMAIGGYSTNGY
jgi:hypothetical protein